MYKKYFYIIQNMLIFWIIWISIANSNANFSKTEFSADDSITKFVWKNVGFNEKKYVPKNLKKISWKFVTWKWELRIEAKEALDDLAKNFYENFWKKIIINSAYRSFDYQVWIEKTSPSCIKDNLCAKAWFSEHQTWLAIDIFWVTTNEKYYNWLKENAHKYGFTQSYQKWEEIDWYKVEKWHWRFVGYDLAYELKEKNKTFTEYIYSENNKTEENLSYFEKQNIQKSIKNIFEIKSKDELKEIYEKMLKIEKNSENNLKINYLISEFKTTYEMQILLWN